MLIATMRVSWGGNGLQVSQNGSALINISKEFNFNTKLYSFDTRVHKTKLHSRVN